MSIHRALNPLPSNISIELGQGGHIKRLENSLKNAKFEQDNFLIMYDNEFVMDVIGSRMVSKILKYKAANSVPYIERSKSFHEKVGLVTQRNCHHSENQVQVNSFLFRHLRRQRPITDHRYRD